MKRIEPVVSGEEASHTPCLFVEAIVKYSSTMKLATNNRLQTRSGCLQGASVCVPSTFPCVRVASFGFPDRRRWNGRVV